MDAIFVANNFMTIGTMLYFKEQKIRVPKDISLIGFDDYPWAAITKPPLSVVKQPSSSMGKKAAHLIIDKIEDPNIKPTNHLFETELVIRNSC